MSAPRHVRDSALVALVALVAVSLPVAAGPTGAPAPPPVAEPAVAATSASTASAIAAPICSVPRGAGILALVPPAVPDGTAPDAGAGEPAAGDAGLGDPAVGVTRTAVVDRFEGDRAVLLVEARGEVVARRLVRRAALPRAARHDDAVVAITVVADSVAAITYRPAETARRKRAVRRRFERLSEPAPGRSGPVPC